MCWHTHKPPETSASFVASPPLAGAPAAHCFSLPCCCLLQINGNPRLSALEFPLLEVVDSTFEVSCPRAADFASTHRPACTISLCASPHSLWSCPRCTSPLAYTAACRSPTHPHILLVLLPSQVVGNLNLMDVTFPNLTSTGVFEVRG